MQIDPKSEITLKYILKPSIGLVPDTYQLIIRVFYQDANYEYSSMVINKPINFHAPSSTGFLGLLTTLVLLGGIVIGSYYLVNLLVNRFWYANSKQQFDLLDYIKEKTGNKQPGK